MLDRVLGQQPGVICRAAGNHEDLVDFAQLLIGEPLLVEHDPTVDEMAEQGVGHGGRLLGDLLEHEVLVAALLGGRQVPVDVEGASLAGHIVAVEVADPIPIGGDHHRLVLTQLDRVAGVLDERRHVRADEHLAVADPDDQRRGAARGHDRARLVGVGEHQREVAFQPTQHGQHRADKVTGGLAVPKGLRHQVHRHLAVGVAGELHPGGLQLAAQDREVLDDAVVDDGDLAGGVTVWVRVAVGGTAVGGPPGVSQAGVAAQRCGIGVLERLLQVGQSAGTAAHGELAAAVEQCDAGRVVAAVLHPSQRIEDDVVGRSLADVADDSAHSHSA